MILRLVSVALMLVALVNSSSVRAQTAPRLVSVTPTNRAVNVPPTSALVFVFNQAMDVTVPLFQRSPTEIVGNFAIFSPGFDQELLGIWSADERTVTLQPEIQFPDGTFDWTLNPTGSDPLIRIKSKVGIELATISGIFTIGAGRAAPKLGRVTPGNGAHGVPVTSRVVFLFDQPMNTNLPVAGAVSWTGIGLDAAKFSYSWVGGGRSLFCDYATNLPLNIQINWLLNPAAATVKLENQSGVELASDTYGGHFITEAVLPCELTGVPSTWGNYNLYRNSSYEQVSTADPVPASDSPFIFSAIVRSPMAGPAATAGSLTWPDGTQASLTVLDILQYFRSLPSETELEDSDPPGTYTLRFKQTGQPERVIPMTMPDAPPVPKILDFTATQGVDVGADLTLQWNGFPGATANDSISLSISESQGHLVFQAPDPCVPRELPVTATSIVIPAHTFQTNITYTATLSFNRTFYFSTNAVPQMAGYGSVQSTTHFSLVPGGGGLVPAVLSGYQLLPNGNLSFTLTGTSGRTYTIRRAASLDAAVWPAVGAVTMNAAGHAVFEGPPAGQGTPLFYRAVAH